MSHFPKGAKGFARKSATRSPRDRVLIVCEGEKTEPNYLREVRDILDLTSADIEICGKECGTDPMSIYNYAIERFEADKGYDRIFCVFDRDGHTTYSQAVDQINRKKLGGKKLIRSIKSVPCFEYWILLHFEYSTSSFQKTGKKSSGDMAVKAVKKHIPDYNKGTKGISRKIWENTKDAINRAKQSEKQAIQTRTDNPTTEVYFLVEYLIDISK